MRIKQINYNWRFSQETGEEFDHYTLGYNAKIIGDETGDSKIFYVVTNDNQRVLIYNPNLVFMEDNKNE